MVAADVSASTSSPMPASPTPLAFRATMPSKHGRSWARAGVVRRGAPPVSDPP
jgi:hypothetical protein